MNLFNGLTSVLEFVSFPYNLLLTLLFMFVLKIFFPNYHIYKLKKYQLQPPKDYLQFIYT